MLRERTVGSGPAGQAEPGQRWSLEVGVGASLASEFPVFSLHLALLCHLVHLQLELAAVADELR
jgi:hypothetical protein